RYLGQRVRSLPWLRRLQGAAAVTASSATDQVVYADDLVPGTSYELGTWTVTLEELVSFAQQWDPQWFHVDKEAAKDGPFGVIIASGMPSLSIMSRLVVDGALHRWAVIAGRAMEDIQLLNPVRPGMVLRGTLLVDSVEPRGKDRALVWLRCRLLD